MPGGPRTCPAPRARAGAGGRPPPRARRPRASPRTGTPRGSSTPRASTCRSRGTCSGPPPCILCRKRTSFLIEIQSRKTSGVPHDNFGGAVGHRGLRADYATWGYAVGRGDAARRNRFAIAMGGVLRPGRPRSCGRASGTVRFRRAQASVRHGGHRRARARLALPRPDRGMCASFANRLRTLLSWNYGKRTGDRARTELWQRG